MAQMGLVTCSVYLYCTADLLHTPVTLTTHVNAQFYAAVLSHVGHSLFDTWCVVAGM